MLNGVLDRGVCDDLGVFPRSACSSSFAKFAPFSCVVRSSRASRNFSAVQLMVASVLTPPNGRSEISTMSESIMSDDRLL